MDTINSTDTFTPDTSQTDQQVPNIRYTLQTSPVASDNTLPLQTDSPNKLSVYANIGIDSTVF